MPRPAVWERLQSDPIRLRHEPDIFIPIIPATTDANNQDNMSYSNQLIPSMPFNNALDCQIDNNQTSTSLNHDAVHHVSLCVNDLRTTLFIDEDVLNNTKTTTNSNNSASKGIQSKETLHIRTHISLSLSLSLYTYTETRVDILSSMSLHIPRHTRQQQIDSEHNNAIFLI
jgi:hypothetical protein